MVITTCITREWRCPHREDYEVTFGDDEIDVLVTHLPEYVRRWINTVTDGPRCSCCGDLIPKRSLIVGLDIEWLSHGRSNGKGRNPVALLQLCVGGGCLIFQLQYAEKMPKSLINFLRNDNYTFVGVGIDSDAEKLLEDYNLTVSNTVDLRKLASKRLGKRELRGVGLTALAREVLGLKYDKPKKITMSEWDKPYLRKAQVQYASIDAFLSFSIGFSLNAAKR